MQNNKPSKSKHRSKNEIVSQKVSSLWDILGPASSEDLEHMIQTKKAKKQLTRKITALEEDSSSTKNLAQQVLHLIESAQPRNEKDVDNILKEIRKILMEAAD